MLTSCIDRQSHQETESWASVAVTVAAHRIINPHCTTANHPSLLRAHRLLGPRLIRGNDPGDRPTTLPLRLIQQRKLAGAPGHATAACVGACGWLGQRWAKFRACCDAVTGRAGKHLFQQGSLQTKNSYSMLKRTHEATKAHHPPAMARGSAPVAAASASRQYTMSRGDAATEMSPPSWASIHDICMEQVG